MLKKQITYRDLDGNPVTEDFYFNLNKAEIAELEMSKRGGMMAYINSMMKDVEGNGGVIMAAFKDILLMSVGKRSDDNRRFVKSEEIKNDFLHSDAYSELFMELVTDAKAAADFINAVVPADLIAEATDGLPDQIPAYKREKREATSAELTAMSRDEMIEAYRYREELRGTSAQIETSPSA